MDEETNRQIYGKTNRQKNTNRWKNRQTDKWIDKQTDSKHTDEWTNKNLKRIKQIDVQTDKLYFSNFKIL